MKELEHIAQNVRSKEDFIAFIGAMADSFRNNKDTWAHKDLDGYLEAMQSWVGDMDGYYLNNGLPVPQDVSWKVFADILMAARIYE